MMTKAWVCSICIAWLYLIPFSGNAVTPMVSAGQYGSLFLNSDGSVWGTGDSGSGATSPVRVLDLPNVIAVETNGLSNFALLADGSLWGSGKNDRGQLGDGTTQYRSKPQPVPGLSGIRAVAAAPSHVLALKEDGTVWAWGRNAGGELGDGTKIDRYVPTQVVGLANVIKISTSELGSLALKSDGTVWVWGNKCCGAAGDGTGSGPEPPLALVPTQVLKLDQAIAIAAGGGHHMALRADGTVWTWGQGRLGQNGTGLLNDQLLPVQIPGLDRVVAIESDSGNSSFAVKADGTAWAWGNNALGQLGVNGITYSAVPIQVPGVSDIVAISADAFHVLAMRSDGTVFAWGYNNFGQLGNGWLQDQAPPGLVLGPGGAGQLNLLAPAPANFNRLPSAQIRLSVTSGTAPLTVQATAINASDPDGTITAYYWKSDDGQQASGASATFVYAQARNYLITLLIEDNAGGRMSVKAGVVVTPAPVGAVSTNPKIGGNGSVSVALANDGRIRTWGQGWLLGLYGTFPDTVSHPIANGITGAVDVAVGGSTVHVLLADGAVVGWGNNISGEVGSGTNAPQIFPQRLPGLPPVQALAAGSNNYLALARDGRVFSWGNNADGALGLGDTENRFAPTEIPGLDNVTAIAAGYNLSVALKGDGSVWAWGRNDGYELGDGTRISRNRPIQVPGLVNVRKIFVAGRIFASKADGTVWVTGNLPTAIPGDPGPASGARHIAVYDGIDQIAGSGPHVIALKADGTVWMGGKQSSMALGFESGGDIVGLRQLPDITDAIWVAGSGNFSVVARRDGTVLAWGRNNLGQLGDGTYANHLTPALVVNETVDGPLDLIPEVPNDIAPDKIPPFFVDASGTVSGPAASVSTTTKFNAVDVGKSGAVFVTAMVPASSVGTVRSVPRMGQAAVERAAANDSSYVLIQLTATGWQQVVNGQLIPYASGVLGDQLATQTILNDTDTTGLKGAQFCLGYGTSADEMIATGRMRTVATIPTDPGATNTATVSCIGLGSVVGGGPSPIPGGVLTSFGTRGTVTPTTPMYGSFALANTSEMYIAVRGPSLGTLGFTQNPLDLPNLRVYDASAKDLLGVIAGCPSGVTVSNYYRTIGGWLDMRDTCVSATLPAGVYTFTINPNTASSSGELLFEVRVNPLSNPSPGGAMTVFGTRGTVTPTTPMYGSFALVNPSEIYTAVLGPTLGILAYTNNPLNLPNVRVYDASGKDVLGNANGGVTVSGCPGSATVASYYANIRGGALDANDTCVSASLPAGVYTFTINPNTPSSSGELLFEVTVNP